MEVFQDLKIFVPKHQEKDFFKRLLDKVSESNWKHKSEFETDYKRNTASSEEVIMCFETAELPYAGEKLKVYIWLWKKIDYFEVFNIVPVGIGSIDYSQYNFALNQFYKVCIQKIENEFDLKIDFSSPNKSIIDLIGKDAGEALIKFSRNANKTTGNTNPFDFSRWCDFVFILHRNKIALNIDDFERWLEEEEAWSNKVASRLGSNLEYALNILERYEQS